MYEFHYDYMKQRYGANFQLCYMDTDSLVHDIKANDFCKNITSDVEDRLSMSGYSCSLVIPLSIDVTKKVIGLMKDELGGRIMTKFVALRPKLYVYEILSGSGDKRCKGVKKCILRKLLDFDDYKQLFMGKNVFWKQFMFRNKLHEVHTVKVNKTTEITTSE